MSYTPPIHKPRTVSPSMVIIAGKFTGNGTGTPTGLVGDGAASVSREALGVYRITLSKVYPRIDSANANILEGTVAGLTVRLKAYDESAKTVDFAVYDGAGTTDTAVDLTSSDELLFQIYARDTKV